MDFFLLKFSLALFCFASQTCKHPILVFTSLAIGRVASAIKSYENRVTRPVHALTLYLNPLRSTRPGPQLPCLNPRSDPHRWSLSLEPCANSLFWIPSWGSHQTLSRWVLVTWTIQKATGPMCIRTTINPPTNHSFQTHAPGHVKTLSPMLRLIPWVPPNSLVHCLFIYLFFLS